MALPFIVITPAAAKRLGKSLARVNTAAASLAAQLMALGVGTALPKAVRVKKPRKARTPKAEKSAKAVKPDPITT